uniref:Uncharacterized protein n=1 Tax=Tanacetum cinerariifolium TaxID=118510 RepID=A0A699SRR9_TANCI|nr:hypothetical protein [Tanacetum cinerariifolium]
MGGIRLGRLNEPRLKFFAEKFNLRRSSRAAKQLPLAFTSQWFAGTKHWLRRTSHRAAAGPGGQPHGIAARCAGACVGLGHGRRARGSLVSGARLPGQAGRGGPVAGDAARHPGGWALHAHGQGPQGHPHDRRYSDG